MKRLIKLLFFVIGLSFAGGAYAQTFKVTDMQFGPDVNDDAKQNALSGLGEKLSFEEFDNYLRVTPLSGDEVMHLEKQSGNVFKYSKGKSSMTVTLEKRSGYLRSAKMEVRKQGRLFFTATLKRI